MIELAGLTATLGAVKTISEIAKNLNSAELTQKIIELQSAIMDMQRDMHELQANYFAAVGENRELKDRLRTSENLIWAENVYWKRDPENHLDGPYCPVCWDDREKLVRLKFHEEAQYSGKLARRYDCVLHSTIYLLRPEIFNPNPPQIS